MARCPPPAVPIGRSTLCSPKAHPLRELAATLLRDGDSDLEHIRLEANWPGMRILDQRAAPAQWRRGQAAPAGCGPVQKSSSPL
ncbi:MAG: hypothetical protein R2932_20995 [Caldilineaceae bacterium]